MNLLIETESFQLVIQTSAADNIHQGQLFPGQVGQLRAPSLDKEVGTVSPQSRMEGNLQQQGSLSLAKICKACRIKSASIILQRK